MFVTFLPPLLHSWDSTSSALPSLGGVYSLLYDGRHLDRELPVRSVNDRHPVRTIDDPTHESENPPFSLAWNGHIKVLNGPIALNLLAAIEDSERLAVGVPLVYTYLDRLPPWVAHHNALDGYSAQPNIGDNNAYALGKNAIERTACKRLDNS